ncbi:MAG TPA: DUF721 domain-containing protein [Candidatus Cloacimonadota bacterium]|nr:DUF721 domain-containing protein [Candidatus Cloacimonadota bacterium]HPS38682.1 DUF721 domain-containing protein [Candidatus Cloacimonadota bacterium]
MAYSFDEACKNVLFRLAGDKHSEFVRLYLLWKDTVGPLLAEKSHPLKLDGSILYVGVANNSWMQELVILKPKIIFTYNKKHQAHLTEIIFTIRTRL